MVTIDYLQGEVPNFTDAGTFFCDFCPQKFENRKDRNVHILGHFTHKLCSVCNNFLLKIGDNFYVLHNSTTCISNCGKCNDSVTIANESIIALEKFDNNIVQSELVCFDESQTKLETNEENMVSEKGNRLKKSETTQSNVNKPKRQPRQRKITSYDSKLVSTPESNNLKNERIIRKYKCKFEECGEMVSRNRWSYHMAKHSDIRFECDICKKKFMTKNQLRLHILNVHDPKSKKFKCDVCGSLYLTAGILASHHRLSHLKEWNFTCSQCGKTFRSKLQLQFHMNVHTGEKPYECGYDGCTKRFRNISQRTEHLRSHTGVKPYNCTETGCDRQFAYSIDFKRHKFKSHGIFTKKFPCQICLEIFPENMLLKKHMKKHNIQP